MSGRHCISNRQRRARGHALTVRARSYAPRECLTPAGGARRMNGRACHVTRGQCDSRVSGLDSIKRERVGSRGRVIDTRSFSSAVD